MDLKKLKQKLLMKKKILNYIKINGLEGYKFNNYMRNNNESFKRN